VDDKQPKIERPLWVKMGVWGLPNRASVWAFFWLSLILAGVCLVYSFWNIRALGGGLFLLAALWYYLTIRWIDRHDHWA
jgi:hypothetical protein